MKTGKKRNNDSENECSVRDRSVHFITSVPARWPARWSLQLMQSRSGELRSQRRCQGAAKRTLSWRLSRSLCCLLAQHAQPPVDLQSQHSTLAAPKHLPASTDRQLVSTGRAIRACTTCTKHILPILGHDRMPGRLPRSVSVHALILPALRNPTRCNASPRRHTLLRPVDGTTFLS